MKKGVTMTPENSMTPSRNFVMEPFRLFPDIDRMFLEPLTMRKLMLPMEENYWPMALDPGLRHLRD